MIQVPFFQYLLNFIITDLCYMYEALQAVCVYTDATIPTSEK